MWFDDDEMMGRRTGGRRQSVLRVNASLSAQRKARMERATAFLLAPAGIAACGLIGWLALKLLGGVFFSSNPRFTITNLEIKGGDMITPDLVREYTGIKEGMNLFGANISRVRADFLRQAPNVKSLEITRILPDTMKISLVERIPVARIGSRGNLHVDSEGCVFRQKAGAIGLPIISGCNEDNLHPGGMLGKAAAPAIEIIEVCDDPRFGLVVEQIDLSNPKHMAVYVSCGGTTKEGKLAWDGMGVGSESKRHLAEKLNLVSQVLHSEKGRTCARFNATYTDGRISVE